jgi:diguanylate cyclase (GGDEF)-like protein/putative nucleotidyltransferase with HDIG domain
LRIPGQAGGDTNDSLMEAYPKRVLVVEDDEDHAFLISKTLERWAVGKNCTFHIVDSVEKAVPLLAQSKYDLILSDYHLPGKNGFELLCDAQKRKLSVPMILMTAVGDEALATKALKAGFFDYITKSEHYIRSLPKAIVDAYQRYLLREQEKETRKELAKKNEELSTKNEQLAELSISDDLTGLYNHRFLQEKFTEEFARSSRYHYPLSCLMIDIDYFKGINDSFGHQAGDKVLQELADFFSKYLRRADTIARYGGEEFVILLPHATYEGASTLAERLRKRVMDLTFAEALQLSIKISVSIGVSSYPEDPVDQKDTMLFYADKALYRAKASGRNRVCLYQTITREFANRGTGVKIKDDQMLELRQRLIDISEMAKRAYIEATKALINALEIKDQHTLGHAARVAHTSAEIAKEMGFGIEDVRIIEHAGLLHDIGKICLREDILLKPGSFTKQEYDQMKTHPLLGFQIVKPIKFLSEEASIILHHHEWYDGSGYPHHLKGKEIPVGARIVACTDAYDTMRVACSRYKGTMNCFEAVQELIDYSGTQFDPEVVHYFIQMLIKKKDLKADTYDQKKLEGVLKKLAA